MREELEIYGWRIECDRQATAQIHAQMERGGPEECGCLDCKNWAAVRSVAYPKEIITLFQRLGIQLNRETEMGSALDLGDNRYLYNGWFHFIGKILSGPATREKVDTVEPNGKAQSSEVFELKLHKVTPQFSIGFSEKKYLLPREFKDQNTIQLEFIVEVPWVLKETAPK